MSATSWASIAIMAKNAGSLYPELCAAQWAVESGWGKYTSGKNNFFGLKGKGSSKTTSEFIDGKEVSIADEFIDFETEEDCVKYLVDHWYKDYTYNGKTYKGVNNAKDKRDAAKMLVDQGYCTDPSYAVKLTKLMDTNSIPDPIETPITQHLLLKDAAKYYKGLTHQTEAWDELQKVLSDEILSRFTLKYRGRLLPETENPHKCKLNVPYFYQRDSKTGHGERSCQSSALAMVIKFIRPQLITDDDNYLDIVFRYGDTVSQTAHKKAMDFLGIKYKFSQSGKETDLLKILDDGMPVPIGVLHKGSVGSPSGGGHWITLIGYDDEYFNVHDPFGEMDLINGGYPKAGPVDGKDTRYTRANLMKRWLIQSNSDGWYWDLRGN